MRVKLSDLTKYSKGVQINGDNLIDDGKYIYLNGGINPSGRWNEANVDCNTITISEGGNSSGYINYLTEPFWCGAHCYYLYDGPKNTRYLYYALKSQQERLFRIRSGACMPNIKKADLGKFEFEYNSDENKQEEVVSVLSMVESILDDRKRELVLLDNLIKARFVEMFGDYHINNKGFETHPGSELFKFSSGKFLPEEKRLSDGVPVYGGNGIAWYTDMPLINYPTIIIGRVGALCGNIHTVYEPVWITDNAIYIKEQKTDKFTLEFLTEMMTIMDFYQYADFSGQPKITQKPLETVKYLTPPIKMQNEFTSFCKQVDKSKFVKINLVIYENTI